MRRRRSWSALCGAFFIVLGSLAPPAAPAAAKKPIDYTAYDGWKAIRGAKISDDGAWLAYALTPQDGDPTLVVRNLGTGSEMTQPRGSAPAFTADAKFVVYTVAAPKKDVDAAKRAKKKDEDAPKDGLGILELRTGNVATFERVKNVQIAREGGRYIAFRLEPSPRPSPSASPLAAATAAPSAPPTGEPGPSTSSVPSPSPSASPKADPKKKDEGSGLVVRDLQNGTNVNVADVTDYVLADDDRTVSYATETTDGKGDGVHVRDLATGAVADVLAGNGRYKNLAAARDGSSLAFLSDVTTYAQDAPRYDAYLADLRATRPTARPVVTAESPGVPRAAAPSDNAKLSFSKDGKRLFLGTAAAPTPAPSDTPEPIKVDLWTYKDLRLQSVQSHDAAEDRKRTYRGVYDLSANRYAQLGTPEMKQIVTTENPRVALGLDERPYAIESSWVGEAATDVYAVSLADGARKLLLRKGNSVQLSPGGVYALAWNAALRRWVAIRTQDGKRTILARNEKVAFHDETDDHPAPPPPYGTGGWTAGDRGVVIYDRYDAWLADPATGDAVALTRGVGRASKVAYSVVETDPERSAHPADEPYLLSLSDQRSYASGFARVPARGGTPRTLLRADKTVSNALAQFGTVHQRIAPPLKARHADRVVFTEESYREFRDLWTSDLSFAHPRKVTDANPQLAEYRWGDERLISYAGAGKVPLRAVLLTPDGFDPRKTYPMLVYFYEKWSDQYHTFYAPGPRYPTISRYVSNGYVVLLPDVVYRTGHPGSSALRCINAAVDAVTARGFVDPKRVGIAGHSWAAYQIAYILTQTDRFRAAEAGAAVANMTSAYGGIRLESGIVRESQYEHGQSRIGATPWDRPDLYLENSPLFHIKNIRTPYLTMHNDADGAVPFSQGVEFLTALRRLGKVAYLFSFNGKDHNLRDMPKDRDELKYWTVHFDEWFDHWLKGAPRPAWFDGVDYLHRGERDVRPLFGEGPLGR